MAQVKEHIISREAKTGLSLLRNQMETLATQARDGAVKMTVKESRVVTQRNSWKTNISRQCLKKKK